MRKLFPVLAAGVLTVGVALSSSSASAVPAHSRAAGVGSERVPSFVSAHAKVTKLSISAASSGKLMFSTDSLKAKAGTIIITFTNHAPEAHNLTVVRGTNGAKVGATPTFMGGSRKLTLHLKAGKYTYYCSVPGHRMGGMQGTLTVS